MRRLSIRWKLTLWYGGVLALVLTVFSSAVYLTMRHQLLGRIDQGLKEELADVLSEVRQAQDEQSLHDWLERRFARHEGFDFQITRANGECFFVSQRLGEAMLPLPEEGNLSESATFRQVSFDDVKRWRVVNVKVNGPQEAVTIQVARSLASFTHESQELLLTLYLTGPLTLLLAVGGGYFLARRALAPVDQITGTANQITADRLDRRISIPNPDDELGALARTLNRMIERLERSFTEMQRFTADAAHELRTPLAVIRNEAEVALRVQRTPEQYSQVLENLLEEVNRLSHIAEQLLFLSRQDSGLQPSTRDEVAVNELLQDVVGNMQLVAQEKGLTLVLAENAPIRIVTDSQQLRRVAYNLLDNAIKYTSPGGTVTVTGEGSATDWLLTVTDTGMGVPPEHLPHVFERFYRVDPARTGDSAGAGLGLAICRSIVLLLGGNIKMESVEGRGTSVCVRLSIIDQCQTTDRL